MVSYIIVEVIVVHAKGLRSRTLMFVLFVRDSLEAGMSTVAYVCLVRVRVCARMGANTRVFLGVCWVYLGVCTGVYSYVHGLARPRWCVYL